MKSMIKMCVVVLIVVTHLDVQAAAVRSKRVRAVAGVASMTERVNVLLKRWHRTKQGLERLTKEDACLTQPQGVHKVFKVGDAQVKHDLELDNLVSVSDRVVKELNILFAAYNQEIDQLKAKVFVAKRQKEQYAKHPDSRPEPIDYDKLIASLVLQIHEKRSLREEILGLLKSLEPLSLLQQGVKHGAEAEVSDLGPKRVRVTVPTSSQ